MSIVSVTTLEEKKYKLSVTLGNNIIENVIVTEDGLYSIYYIKNGTSINHTGRIINVVQNKFIPKNNYVLFDWSEDNSNRQERIYFYQIQYLRDITPNNAYHIALEHGFIGTIDDWMESMRGHSGLSAYEIAVNNGYVGTEEEWLDGIRGIEGKSAYGIAVENGFKGTEKEWLDSLVGSTGKSAYEIAVENGFKGTEEEWIKNYDAVIIREDIDSIIDALTWKSEV